MKISNMRLGSRSARVGYAAALAVGSLCAVQSASAQSPVNTWDGSAADNLWATTSNWSLDALPFISGTHADDAIFPDGIGALTITVPTSAQTGRLNMQNSAAMTFTTASGSMNMTLRHGILLNPGSGPVTLTHPTGTAETVNTNGTSQSFINNSTSTLTISSNLGNVNNAGSTLTVDGPGPIVFSGGGFSDRFTGSNPQPTTSVIKNGAGSLEIQAGTFKGSFTMNAGVLRVRSNTAFGAVAKTVTFNAGTMSAVNGNRTASNLISWAIGGDVGFGGFGSTLQLDGTVNLGGVVRTIDVGTTGGGLGNVSFVGAVSNGGIIKTGPNFITSNSPSTYTGNTVVNGGVLQWVNTSDIQAGAIVTGPFGTGTVTMNTGTTLRGNDGTGRLLQNNVVVNGNVTLGGSSASPSPNNTQTGSTTFNSTDGVDVLAAPATFTLGSDTNLTTLSDATIANPLTSAFNLTKSGAADLFLSNNNSASYTGTTTVSAGRLVVQTLGALGSTGNGTSVTSGGELLYSGVAVNGTESEPITIAGPGIPASTVGGALTVGNSAVVNFPNAINLAAAATVHVTGSGTATFAGGITGTDVNLTLRGGGGGNVTGGISLGTGQLIKDQSGAWTLSGNNSYTGGTNIIAGTLNVGSGGTSGNLGSGNITNTGTLNFNRSDSVAVSDVISGTGAVSNSGTGTTTLSATNTYTGGTSVSAGKLIVNRLHEGNPVSLTGGTLQVADSSPTLPASPSGNNASVSRPSALTIANDAAPLGTRVYTGTLDLGNNDLILDYDPINPAADIEDMVRSGYNGGAWTGTGITSSTAANVLANGNYALAVADNALLTNKFGDGTGGKPQFSGQNVDDTTVLVKFTHRVDLDLDGFVTPNDAIIFATNYIQNGNGNWITGDVDYDGKHTQNDAIIFATFYNGTLPSLPEPGIATVALGAAGLLLRRGRRA